MSQASDSPTTLSTSLTTPVRVDRPSGAQAVDWRNVVSSSRQGDPSTYGGSSSSCGSTMSDSCSALNLDPSTSKLVRAMTESLQSTVSQGSTALFEGDSHNLGQVSFADRPASPSFRPNRPVTSLSSTSRQSVNTDGPAVSQIPEPAVSSASGSVVPHDTSIQAPETSSDAHTYLRRLVDEVMGSGGTGDQGFDGYANSMASLDIPIIADNGASLANAAAGFAALLAMAVYCWARIMENPSIFKTRLTGLRLQLEFLRIELLSIREFIIKKRLDIQSRLGYTLGNFMKAMNFFSEVINNPRFNSPE